MPGPYVEDMRSTRRGNCRSMKEEIGKHADVTTKLSSQLFLSPNIRHSVELKATIMVVMERNNVTKPIISLWGRT